MDNNMHHILNVNGGADDNADDDYDDCNDDIDDDDGGSDVDSDDEESDDDGHYCYVDYDEYDYALGVDDEWNYCVGVRIGRAKLDKLHQKKIVS